VKNKENLINIQNMVTGYSHVNEIRLKKILVVDDDIGDVIWLKKVLSLEYLVLEANNGLQAVKTAARENPDLILMDVMMPKSSGYTACARIKSDPNTKDIPIIMVTGIGQELNKEFSEQIGADGYLVKPMQPDELRNTISEFLRAT